MLNFRKCSVCCQPAREGYHCFDPDLQSVISAIFVFESLVDKHTSTVCFNVYV